MKISKEILKNKPAVSVFKKRLTVKKPEVKVESLADVIGEDSWVHRRSPGATFSNLVLPDPNILELISGLQSSQKSNASKLSAEGAARTKKDVSLQAQIDALVAAAVTEGNYTTWTIQAIYDTGVNIATADGVLPRNNGNISWYDQSVDTIYIISPAAVLLATIDGGFEEVEGGRWRSISDRYSLCLEHVGANKVAISVVEGLTKLWRRVVSDDMDGYTLTASPLYGSLMGISPSGEWIAVIAKEAVTSHGIMFIYQGS